MALPASGPINVTNILTELGLGQQAANLGRSDMRTLAGVASGAIHMSDFYGKSQGPLQITSGKAFRFYPSVATSSCWINAMALDESSNMLYVWVTNNSSYALLKYDASQYFAGLQTPIAAWTYSTQIGNIARMKAVNGRVYVTSSSGQCAAINGSTGAIIWAYSVTCSDLDVRASDDTVVLACGSTYSGFFLVINSAGTIVAKRQYTSGAYRYDPRNVHVVGNLAIAVTYIANTSTLAFFAFDIDTGAIFWGRNGFATITYSTSLTVTSYSGYDPTSGLFVVSYGTTTRNSAVLAINASTGLNAWQVGFNSIRMPRLVGGGGKIAVCESSSSSTLYSQLAVLNASDGALTKLAIWAGPSQVGSPVIGSAVFDPDQGALYFGAQMNSYVHQQSAASGTTSGQCAVLVQAPNTLPNASYGLSSIQSSAGVTGTPTINQGASITPTLGTNTTTVNSLTTITVTSGVPSTILTGYV